MIDYNKIFDLTKSLNILYIEDDLAFQKETTKVFEELFNKVDVSSNGVEGLKKYNEYLQKEQKPYDIVITDLNMPKMGGIELVKELYIINEKQAIIVISAHDESKYLFELVNLGIEQFLIKPLDYDIMMKVLFKVSNKLVNGNKIEEKITKFQLKDDYFWDMEKSLLFDKEEIIKLTKKETLLFILLVKNKDRISTNEEIINNIYDEPHLGNSDSLKTLISRVRKKVPKHTIESVYSLGYRLEL